MHPAFTPDWEVEAEAQDENSLWQLNSLLIYLEILEFYAPLCQSVTLLQLSNFVRHSSRSDCFWTFAFSTCLIFGALLNSSSFFFFNYPKMSYEHGGGAHPRISEVMETIPYRMSAKVVGVTELVLTIFLFIVVLIVAIIATTGTFRPEIISDLGQTLTSGDKEVMELIKDVLVIVLAILLVLLCVEMGFAYCLVEATSTISVSLDE